MQKGPMFMFGSSMDLLFFNILLDFSSKTFRLNLKEETSLQALYTLSPSFIKINILLSSHCNK